MHHIRFPWDPLAVFKGPTSKRGEKGRGGKAKGREGRDPDSPVGESGSAKWCKKWSFGTKIGLLGS